MHKSELPKIFWRRENLYKLGLIILGFTLLPGVVHLVGKILGTSSITIEASYLEFYGSLLDIGKDGFIAWSIAFAPYMAYEVYMLLKSFGTKRNVTDQRDA